MSRFDPTMDDGWERDERGGPDQGDGRRRGDEEAERRPPGVDAYACMRLADEPDEGPRRTVLDAGWHPARVVEARDNVETRAGDGVMLVVGLEVAGRVRLRAWCVHQHPDRRAVAAGRKKIAALLEGTGYDGPRRLDPQRLVGRDVDVRLAVEEWEGSPVNAVKAFGAPRRRSAS